MLERHIKILELVQEQGFVAIEELAQKFSVTSQTIRRDINKLCDEGALNRYHGGASLPSSVENLAYRARQVLCQEEKIQIARQAAENIPDHASVFINIGTTTEEVAKLLINRKGLRVITNNLNVALILSGNENIEVIIASGVVRSRDRGITGDATIDFIKQFKVDYGIIGISSIDEDGTLLDYDYNEVRVAKTIIDNSRKVFLLADHTKFERNAMVCLCHISEIDTFFTDKQPSSKIIEILKTSGVSLQVAKSA